MNNKLRDKTQWGAHLATSAGYFCIFFLFMIIDWSLNAYLQMHEIVISGFDIKKNALIEGYVMHILFVCLLLFFCLRLSYSENFWMLSHFWRWTRLKLCFKKLREQAIKNVFMLLFQSFYRDQAFGMGGGAGGLSGTGTTLPFNGVSQGTMDKVEDRDCGSWHHPFLQCYLSGHHGKRRALETYHHWTLLWSLLGSGHLHVNI